MNRQSSPRNEPSEESYRAVLLRQISQPIGMGICALLAIDLMILTALLFTHMPAGYQFACIVMLATPVLAATFVLTRLALPAAPKPPALPTVLTETAAPEKAEPRHNEPLRLLEEMEQIVDRTRQLPLNVAVGFDEEQFTYASVKLRSALQALELPAPEAERDNERPVTEVTPLADDPVALGTSEGSNYEVAGSTIEEASQSIEDALASAEMAAVLQQASIAEAPEASAVVYQRVAEAESLAEVPPQVADAKEHDTLPAPPAPPSVHRSGAAVSEARMHLRQGDSRAALKALESLVDVDETGEVCELRGTAYELQGERQAALTALRMAVERAPNRASARYNYAVVLADERRVEEALREAEAALELRPDYAAARELLESLRAQVSPLTAVT